MANIFPINKVKEQASKIKTDSILDSIKIIEKWHNHYYEGSLKSDKETTIEQSYNNDFFINILGYKTKPNNEWTFKPQPSTIIGQHPDAILSNSDDNNVFAVIEFKGANIPLDRPQRRAGNLSPVQQAFKYKPLYRQCPFVIVSNFWEFRIYQDNQLDYEYWTLDDLMDPKDDYINFKSWYYLLCEKNFIGKDGKSNTENLITEVRVEQEKISKIFYKEYRDSRLELLRDMYKKNIEVRENIDFGISKAQKIIDRIVFICFAEDRGLIPDNKLHEVIDYAKNNPYSDIWETLKGFFNAIDIGSNKLEIPNGYNGGLFKVDEDLNNLKISDEALLNVAKLSKYNFDQDLSVTILGHIFEQSISDLEEIKSKVNHDEKNSNSKRKKEGIFYTPDYIVKFIVDNSLGNYLREKEESIKVEFGLKESILDKNYEKREREAYLKYQDFLQNIKVLDPACGSGAFLVYVFDYLLAENKRVGDILFGSLFSTEEYVKDILRNNIFGVDLNEESVEITKLSLWLKTAQKGKKLTSLDKNIKCGNSLIEDSLVADSKSFNWNDSFEEIMNNGGFDVIVGNPPYVATKQIPVTEREYYWKEYKDILISEMDLYEIFTYKSVKDLLKPSGYLGFITPNSYYTNASFKLFRKYLLNKTSIQMIVDFPYRFYPFEDVNKETTIITLKKVITNNDIKMWTIDKNKTKLNEGINDNTLQLNNSINKKELIELYEGKIITNHNCLLKKLVMIKGKFGDKLELHKGWMSVPKYTEINGKNIDKGIFNKEEVNKMGLKNIVKPYLEGKDIHRYYIDKVDKFVNITNLDKKTEKWHYQEKIITQRIVGQNKNKIFATIGDSNSIIFPNANLVNCRYEEDPRIYLAILNSSLISYYYNLYYGESNTNLTKLAFESLPLPKIKEEYKKDLINHVNQIIEKTKELMVLKNKFLHRLSSSYPMVKSSKKLSTFEELTFEEFNIILFKSKVKLSLKEKDVWEEYFEEYKEKLLNIKYIINSIEKTLDDTVYKIYGISAEEVEMIESFK